jgi:hypothetical protein
LAVRSGHGWYGSGDDWPVSAHTNPSDPDQSVSARPRVIRSPPTGHGGSPRANVTSAGHVLVAAGRPTLTPKAPGTHSALVDQPSAGQQIGRAGGSVFAQVGWARRLGQVGQLVEAGSPNPFIQAAIGLWLGRRPQLHDPSCTTRLHAGTHTYVPWADRRPCAREQKNLDRRDLDHHRLRSCTMHTSNTTELAASTVTRMARPARGYQLDAPSVVAGHNPGLRRARDRSPIGCAARCWGACPTRTGHRIRHPRRAIAQVSLLRAPAPVRDGTSSGGPTSGKHRHRGRRL